MGDWGDDEDFDPVAPGLKAEQLKSIWDDEDADDHNVKESWEDDEDVTKPPTPGPPVEKLASKPSAVASGKKAKKPEAMTPQVHDEVLADPVLEKLRQQRLVEEADYRSTADLFAKKENEKSLDNFIPKSDTDFAEYAELLSHKIRPYEKSFHYMGLLKAMMRFSMTSLKAADAKEIASTVTTIANEKLKAEKEANSSKKKQGAKKKQLHVEKQADDMVVGAYDDAADDYDFM